jgi:hypothetical protein
MNAAFNSMSDLVADAEDLMARVSHSQTPQVRALVDTMQVFVDHVKGRVRSRARELRLHQDSARSWLDNPLVYIAAGASLAIGIAAWRRLQRKSQT